MAQHAHGTHPGVDMPVRRSISVISITLIQIILTLRWRARGRRFASSGLIPNGLAAKFPDHVPASTWRPNADRQFDFAKRDLPLKFRPAAIRASAGCTPWGSGGATCDRRSWSGLRSRSHGAGRLAAWGARQALTISARTAAFHRSSDPLADRPCTAVITSGETQRLDCLPASP